MSLDELRNDIIIKQKKGLPFIMASVIIWLLIVLVSILNINMDMKNLSKEDQLKELKKLESFPKSIKKVIEPKMDLEKIKKQLQKSYFFSILISYGKNGAFPYLFVFHSLGVVFHLE